MELSLIKEMFEYSAYAILGILGLFICFCGLFVWQSRLLPSRLNDIGWKRVDYAWIIAGSMGLIFQFIQVGLDSKLSNLRVEETFGQLSAQSLNIAADELSDARICLPISVKKDDVLERESAQQLASACDLFQKIRPVNRVDTKVDRNVFMNYDSVFPEAERFSDPLIVEQVKRFKRAYADYEEQAQALHKTQYAAYVYERYLKLLQLMATPLLVVAVALRLAKVKGEIRLKTHPMENKPDNSISPQALANAVKGLATSAQVDDLVVRLNKLESSNRLKLNIIFIMMFVLGAGIISVFMLSNVH
ncbi:hypothetical protein C1X59_17190 [Pseudomonas sp. FW215-R2]|uniref:hypothetical protein n=1 Tax=unclassified Pseudomonas TaxID=196821 RepID=UPI000C87F734|nr:MULTISPECIES: hypothetical protein [unclassified Pseudomonas]PMW99555.1 hypothetical protein C1X59_17190 [Pseudomonas sp. FW215-R2]PMX07443.1 hypothetical protein C1X60_20690 [Pseudomonas sp. FW215-L1]PMX20276.1 hypothetical protein C1X57_21610 [Pseudomonas sp. FW215-E1]PNA27387.1 hypothetical protein C1X58_19055 [Pseudomonas sp. FW215-R4]